MKNGVFWDVMPCDSYKESHGVTSQETPFFNSNIIGFTVNCGVASCSGWTHTEGVNDKSLLVIQETSVYLPRW
jgi:hypothetical protein